VFLRVSLSEKLLEMMFVGVTSQKGGWAPCHENLCEFSVLLFGNIVEDLVVFFEVGFDQVKLLVSAPETWNLLLRFKDWVLWIEVSEVSPELSLNVRVGKGVVADLLDLVGLIWGIIFESLGLKSILLFDWEALGSAIGLNNGIFVLRSQSCLKFNTIDSDLTTFNPRTSKL
jgi:hypothetical protein